MKKITLVLLALISLPSFAQEGTISFESSEGYSLGDIYTQNGWTVTGDGDGGYVTNQVISDEMATDGTYSLKIDNEPAFPGQQSPVVGAFYNYTSPIPYLNSTYSADIYISELGGANFRFGTVNITEGFFTAILEFDWQGSIWVLDGDSFVETITWSDMTWYNIRIEILAATVKYYVNDVEIHEGALDSPFDTEQVRFANDNYGGYAFIDNFKTNDEDLSVNEFNNKTFKHFYNTSTDVLTLESSDIAFSNISLFNLLGQHVMSKDLNQTTETVDLSNLSDGVYLAKISIGNTTQSVKILKQ